MKYVFISKADDNIDKIQHECLEVSIKNIISYSPLNYFKNPFSYTLYKIIFSEDAFILKTTRGLDNKSVWSHEKIFELYKALKYKFTDINETFVIAIHWGDIDSAQGRREYCDKVRKGLKVSRESLILTHYSGINDADGDGDILSRIGDSTDTIVEFVERMEKRIKEDAFLRSAEGLKEIRQYLSTFLLLNSGKRLEGKIQEVKNKLDTSEVDKSILKVLNIKISEIEKPINKQNSVSGSSYEEKVGNIKEYLEKLIDNQLKQAGKEPVYGH